MIWFRPPIKRKPWFDTPLARNYAMQGLATILVGRHLFVPIAVPMEANDRSNLKW